MLKFALTLKPAVNKRVRELNYSADEERDEEDESKNTEDEDISGPIKRVAEDGTSRTVKRVKVRRCGICGSTQHDRRTCTETEKSK